MLQFCIVFLAAMCSVHAQDVIQVVAGQQKTIEIGRPRDILIGDSQIAILDYQKGNKAILIGRSPGITSLSLSYSNGREITKTIKVLARDPKQIMEQLKQLFRDIKGLSFRTAGDFPIIEGSIESDSDYKYFSAVMPRYPDVLNLVTIKTKKVMVGISVKIIEANITKTQEYNPTGSRNALFEGTLTRNDLGSRGKIQSDNYTVSIKSNLLSMLEFWLSNGTAQLLADPVVTVLNKEKARFQIGGEIPYEYTTLEGKSVAWKNYGVIITITPEVLASGEILVNLEGEVSNIDATNVTSQNVPGLKKRKIATKVAINNGETLIISGIRHKESSIYKRRIPLLGHLLPFLFYHRTVRYEDKELLILVTPTSPAKINMEDFSKLKKYKQ